MADIACDNKTKVWWVPTIANLAAPTLAELNAGQTMEKTITSDGLMGFEPETAAIETDPLSADFDSAIGGRASYSNMGLRVKKQSGTDTLYTTLTRRAVGFAVVRRDTLSDVAWTADDEVEVYPLECGQRKRLAPEKNTLSRYDIPLFLTSEPELDAVVVAA